MVDTKINPFGWRLLIHDKLVFNGSYVQCLDWAGSLGYRNWCDASDGTCKCDLKPGAKIERAD